MRGARPLRRRTRRPGPSTAPRPSSGPSSRDPSRGARPVTERPSGPRRNAAAAATSAGSSSRFTACGARRSSAPSVRRAAPRRSRCGRSRAERRGGDADVGALEREHLHEPEHAVLRGDVARLERRRDEAVDGRDGEEPAVARGGERVPRVLREQERARQRARPAACPSWSSGNVAHGRDVLEARVRDDRVEPCRRSARAPRRRPRGCPRASRGRRPRGRRRARSQPSARRRSAIAAPMPRAGARDEGARLTGSSGRRPRRRRRACRRPHARSCAPIVACKPQSASSTARRGTSRAPSTRTGTGAGKRTLFSP